MTMEVEHEVMKIDIEPQPVNHFSRLPEAETLPPIPRDLSHHTVLQTPQPSWETLRNILVRIQNNNEEGSTLPLQIFAISWPSYLSQTNSEILKVSLLLSKCDKADEDDKEDWLNAFVTTNKESYNAGQTFALLDLDGHNNENLTDQFSHLCGIATSLIVHWFQAFKYGFMWRKTCGTTVDIISSKCSSMQYSERKWFAHLSEDNSNVLSLAGFIPKNLICISGAARSGKSVLLTRMANRLKNLFKNRLVYYIDLKVFGSQMKEVAAITISKSLNLDQFLELIFEYFKIDNILEKKDLEELLSSTRGNVDDQPKLELFLDGLDQMNKKMRRILLKFLQNDLGSPDQWEFRVWITTRPHLKQRVERVLSLVVFKLKNLCPTDIQNYLKLCEVDQDIIKEVLSSRLGDHLKLDLKTLISIPARLVEFQKLVKEGQLCNLNGLEILREMITNHKEHYKQVKWGNSNPGHRPKRLLNKHVPLAIQSFLKQINLNTRGESSIGHPRLQTAILQVEDKLLEFGLVGKNSNGELQFLHEAFAPFVLVNYYTSHKPSGNLAIDFFLHTLFYQDDCEELRSIYAERLREGVNLDVSDAWSERLTKFLISNYRLSDVNPRCPVDCGNLLQLMIIDQKLLIAKMIVREFPSSHAVELKRLITRKVKVEVNSLEEGGSQSRNYMELSAFSLAIMFGDLELVHLMYTSMGGGPEIDAEIAEYSNLDTCRFSPVHLAVLGCNLKILDYLENKRKLSVSELDLSGSLPLHLVFYNAWDFKFLILEPSSNMLFSESPSSSSSLTSFPSSRYISRHIKIRKYYYDMGDVTQLTDGFTVTHDRIGQLPTLASKLSMYNEHRDFLQMEMKKNHNFSHKPRNIPCGIVYYNNILSYNSIVERLTGGALPNSQDTATALLVEQPFHMACAQGYLPIVECMVIQGMDVGVIGRNGSTALLSAILHGHVHIVKYLLERGIDKCDLDRLINNDTPLLHHIASMNLSKMVEFFVKDLKQDVNMRTSEDLTPLHAASSIHSDMSFETAQVLLDMGADVNAKDKQMLTPLMHACRIPTGNNNHITPNLELIKLLITKGADVNAQNRQGESSLHFAVATGDEILVNHLLACGGEGGKQKINVDIRTRDWGPGIGEGGTRPGSTPLHYACRTTGNLNILKHLIAAGAKVNGEDHLGQIPILILALADEIDEGMAKFLIKHKAWMLHRSKLGKTAFEILSSKYPAFAEYLFRESNRIHMNSYQLPRTS